MPRSAGHFCIYLSKSHDGISDVLYKVLQNRVYEEQNPEGTSEYQNQFTLFEFVFKQFRKSLRNHTQDAESYECAEEIGHQIIDIRQSSAENLHQLN